MLLSGALVALFLVGFWLYCLTDAILTPATECRGLSKPTWIGVIAATFLSLRWTDSDDAVARHPAGRARIFDAGAARRPPKGPDDDPEFLRALDRTIRGY
jgi:hypothetical protein